MLDPFCASAGDFDPRVSYHAAVFLLQRLVSERAAEHRQFLQRLVLRAQSTNDERILDNPYLQMSAIADMQVAS